MYYSTVREVLFCIFWTNVNVQILVKNIGNQGEFKTRQNRHKGQTK